MKRAKLNRGISERISIAIQTVQGCELCLNAHTNAARAAGISPEEIDLSRTGTSEDPRIAAIVAVALKVYREPSTITDAEIAELQMLGYSTREIIDVVGIVSLNILTGAFNLLADLTPNHHS
ncbi:carboxymuconolactone decarboxylase family protein [Leucobacter coleopterorum]|uniref:carboxymuconolactone decarboxylase family protein n=1 Tax=Leucobacter coleopterorum TaxID=2714933 RepID=UPI001FCBDCBF|nr:carboxymuconolactone decarboxylase family protein [Leucobacter coleopterorum]